MASALQEWHTDNAITDSNPIQQLYKDLAWGGLEGTTPYLNAENKPNLPNATDRIRIQERILSEYFNTQSGSQLPKGIPCN